VDFARAYADDTGVPANVCAARRARAAELLASSRGRLTASSLRAILRDHYESGPIHTPRPFDDPQFFSLCMHADPLDNTTAAIVAALPADRAAVAAVWVCLGSPCVGAFLPCYLEGTLPEILTRGGAEPDPESPWWRMRTVLDVVERDFAGLGPRVRARWDAFEGRLATEAAAVEREAAEAGSERASILTRFMARSVAAYVETAGALVREIGTV
jgi:dipeptidase